jgi:hypothetical protein
VTGWTHSNAWVISLLFQRTGHGPKIHPEHSMSYSTSLTMQHAPVSHVCHSINLLGCGCLRYHGYMHKHYCLACPHARGWQPCEDSYQHHSARSTASRYSPLNFLRAIEPGLGAGVPALAVSLPAAGMLSGRLPIQFALQYSTNYAAFRFLRSQTAG